MYFNHILILDNSKLKSLKYSEVLFSWAFCILKYQHQDVTF